MNGSRKSRAEDAYGGNALPLANKRIKQAQETFSRIDTQNHISRKVGLPRAYIYIYSIACRWKNDFFLNKKYLIFIAAATLPFFNMTCCSLF